MGGPGLPTRHCVYRHSGLPPLGDFLVHDTACVDSWPALLRPPVSAYRVIHWLDQDLPATVERNIYTTTHTSGIHIVKKTMMMHSNFKYVTI